MTTRDNLPTTIYNVSRIRDILIQIPVANGVLAKACASSRPRYEEIGKAIMSVFYRLIVLCNLLNVSMEWSMKRKIELNGMKYRKQDVRDGSCNKYTTYSANTGITASTGQTTVDLLVSDADISANENEHFSMVVEDIIEELRAFNRARGWEKTHTIRNLILCLSGEIGELTEIFQWKKDDGMKLEKETIDKASQEIADIGIYLLNLATTCNIRLEERFYNDYISRIARKYNYDERKTMEGGVLCWYRLQPDGGDYVYSGVMKTVPPEMAVLYCYPEREDDLSNLKSMLKERKSFVDIVHLHGGHGSKLIENSRHVIVDNYDSFHETIVSHFHYVRKNERLSFDAMECDICNVKTNRNCSGCVMARPMCPDSIQCVKAHCHQQVEWENDNPNNRLPYEQDEFVRRVFDSILAEDNVSYDSSSPTFNSRYINEEGEEIDELDEHAFLQDLTYKFEQSHGPKL